MRKFNYLCSIILVVLLPLMIVILSSNLVLRVSATYTFHFNDSQVMDQVPYNVTGTEMADEISSYWSSFSQDTFQVYETNGTFKDPIMEKDEQQAMRKARKVINLELAVGLLCLLLSLIIYVYLLRHGFVDALRNRYRVCVGVTLGLLLLQGVLCYTKGFRTWMYQSLIGIELHQDSTLVMMLGDPFYKTYVLFGSVLGVAILAFLTYLNYNLTKPERIFY